MRNISEIIEYIEDNGVKFVKLSFSDLLGRHRNVSVNASHFLLESWMYIHVECSSNIRMSEYRTDSFIVATALYAKLQAYMAAGKPVVAMIDGEARTLIAESHCGLSGPVEDSKTLTDNILKMKNPYIAIYMLQNMFWANINLR